MDDVIKAALDGIFKLKSYEEIALRRGVPVERLRPVKAG